MFATSGKRRKALSVAAIGLSTLLLVSCGGEDEEDSTPTAAPATQAVEETEEVAVEPTVEETEVVATPEMGASPAAATPIASGMASPVAPATPLDEVVPVVPNIDLSTPVASPMASPVASPAASPAS